ncbi:MAG: hypothetical protein ACREXY_23625, partial [Gammaproteobacteria bacterium]
AIPTEVKKSFDCPNAQLEIMRRDMPNVDRILVIGWRGAEKHYLEELRQITGKATPVLVVSDSERGLDETTDNLTSTGLDGRSIGWSAGGFGAFMETNGLEAFLDSSIQQIWKAVARDRFAFGERPGSDS